MGINLVRKGAEVVGHVLYIVVWAGGKKLVRVVCQSLCLS